MIPGKIYRMIEPIGHHAEGDLFRCETRCDRKTFYMYSLSRGQSYALYPRRFVEHELNQGDD